MANNKLLFKTSMLNDSSYLTKEDTEVVKNPGAVYFTKDGKIIYDLDANTRLVMSDNVSQATIAKTAEKAIADEKGNSITSYMAQAEWGNKEEETTLFFKDATGKNILVAKLAEKFLPLVGGSANPLTGDLYISTENGDRFLQFSNTGTGYDWRLGYLNAEQGNEKYLTFQNNGVDGSAWIDTLRFSLTDLNAIFSGSILPSATGIKDIGSNNLRWNNLYGQALNIAGNTIIGNNAKNNTHIIKGVITQSGNIIPSNSGTYDLGSNDQKWRTLYVGNGTAGSANSGAIIVNGGIYTTDNIYTDAKISVSDLNSVVFRYDSNTAYSPAAMAIASSPFTKNLWYDYLAFLANGHTIINHQISLDGSTWIDDDALDLDPLFIQKENNKITILNESQLSRRFTISTTSLDYGAISWYEIGVSHTNSFSEFNIYIESSSDGSNWDEIHSSIIKEDSKPYFLYGNIFENKKFLRFTFTKTTNNTSGTVDLTYIKGYSSRKENQELAIENEQLYDWNKNKDIYPHNNTSSLGLSDKKWANIYTRDFNSDNATIQKKLIAGDGTQYSLTDADGSVKILGGIGITENAWIGKTLNVGDGTGSTSSDTGSIQVNGGIGTTEASYIGGELISNGAFTANSTALIKGDITGESNITINGSGQVGNIFTIKDMSSETDENITKVSQDNALIFDKNKDTSWKILNFQEGLSFQASNYNSITQSKGNYQDILKLNYIVTNNQQPIKQSIFFGEILPDRNAVLNLGSENQKWKMLYIGDGTDIIIPANDTTTNDNITTQNATITSNNGVIQANGGIFATGSGRFDGNIYTNSLHVINTEEIGHIAFDREGSNYIQAVNKGGNIAFVVNGNKVSDSKSEMIISNNNIYPGTTKTTSLGTETNEWKSIYSESGYFSGNITITGGELIGNAESATYALRDSEGQKISETYIKSLTADGSTIRFRFGNGEEDQINPTFTPSEIGAATMDEVIIAIQNAIGDAIGGSY